MINRHFRSLLFNAKLKLFMFSTVDHDCSYRIPTVEGGQWIVENCRRGGDRVVGFRPELYENWYKKTENGCNNTCSYTFQKDKDALPKPVVYNDASTMMADVKSRKYNSTMLDLKDFR